MMETAGDQMIKLDESCRDTRNRYIEIKRGWGVVVVVVKINHRKITWKQLNLPKRT